MAPGTLNHNAPNAQETWQRAVLHCDMDAFYVAVHRLRHPEDRGIPVVVGGSPDGRGVVASASYEARKFGVRSAMACAHAQRLCPELKFVRPDWDDIKAHSERVMEALRGFGTVEPMSVDEAYVDVRDALASHLAEVRAEQRDPTRSSAPRASNSQPGDPRSGGEPSTGSRSVNDRAGTYRTPSPDATRNVEADPELLAAAVAMGAMPIPRSVEPDPPPRLPTGPANAFAERVRRAVVDATGLPASVGLATNKLVAKVASDHDKPEGCTVVPPGYEAAFMAPLPVRAIHGVGPRTEERLKDLGIQTCEQLADSSADVLARKFGSHGPSLVRRARGEDRREVAAERGERKQVSAERTFREDIADPDELHDRLRGICDGVADRMARRNLVGNTVAVKFRWPDFTTFTRQRSLEVPVATSEEILQVARVIVQEHRPPDQPMRLLGVAVRSLSPRDEGQLRLWDV